MVDGDGLRGRTDEDNLHANEERTDEEEII